ncbi:MAG: cytochrome c peroxidase [Methylococcaceae bacterium]
MNTISRLGLKGLPNCFELAAFLVVVTLTAAFTHPVMAVSVSQPASLTDFCAANAMNALNFPEMPGSLKCTPAPEPYIIDGSGNKASISPSIIKNKAAVIALGKMLFWDSQAGSDGIACASCHFQAGADNRIKNQIDPGLRNASGTFASDGITPIGHVFDFMASYPNKTNLDPLLPASGKGPNYTLKKADFPLRQYQEPPIPVVGQPLQADRNAPIVYDSDDVVSSQGVYHSTFNGLTPSGKKEKCRKRFPTSGPNMPLFNVGGNSVRQVEPRNTPTIINAVYNFRNFWDGRANNVFNGLDPFGLRRSSATTVPTTMIYIKDTKGKPIPKPIEIYNASLASQAVGPALSDFEMSCGGKEFSELGKKMLSLKPLGKQKVDLSDSVLGSYTTPSGDIKPVNTYKLLIQAAFNNAYWDVPDSQTVDGYKLIENNFSLFWGLAVQAYEATLVSDDSRFDQAINGVDKLTDQEQRGLNLFLNQGKCVACHLGAEFTSASVTHVLNPNNLSNADKYIERMLMGDGGIALYDTGFYNIGVRPSAEDLGVGAGDPYGFPLSYTRNAKMKANNPMDYSIANPNISSLSPDPFQTDSSLFAANLGTIFWNPNTTAYGYLSGTDPVVSDERDAVDGAFKSSTLRNVELTGPYFHNGGQATLEQVVQFYNRGGNRKDLFPNDPICGGAKFANDIYGNTVVAADPVTGLIDSSGFLSGSGSASNLAPDMAGAKDLLTSFCNPTQPPQEILGLSSTDVDDLVAFLKSLTDDRVRWEKAPFDHPSLTIPNGHVGDENKVKYNPAVEQTLVLPAVGAAGRQVKGLPALQSFDAGLK